MIERHTARCHHHHGLVNAAVDVVVAVQIDEVVEGVAERGLH